jgi:hypothetical protein
MNFCVKVSAGVAALLVVALAAVFLLAGSDEKAIEALLEKGAAAAEKGDAETIVGLLSKAYAGPNQTYDQAAQRIRREIHPDRRFGQVSIVGSQIQVDGDQASVSFTIRAKAGPYGLGEAGFRLRLRKEDGVWKVTWAEEAFR